MAWDYWGSPQLTRVTVTDVDDSGPQQLVHATGLQGQDIGQMVRSQPFGWSSNPPAGAEGHALALGGASDRFFALGLEHPQYRPTGSPSGGGVLYDQAGNVIKMWMNAVTMDFRTNPWSVSCKGITITSTGDDVYVKAPGKKIYLGDGPPYYQVVTTGGNSTKVWAAI